MLRVANQLNESRILYELIVSMRVIQRDFKVDFDLINKEL